jgi:methyltransferase (TIGR00027 family)
MREPLIQSISDTARWVAYHRATESERADALFHDPFARQLAGERGESIAKQMQNPLMIALRTLLFDSLIQGWLDREPIDMIVNLAAGLDSRPYRMKLPASLNWVEIDLPEIVTLKKETLAGETPHCKLQIFAQDLADAPLRRRTFAELNVQAARAIVLSEGLLTYLTEEQVAALSTDMHAQSHFQYWIVEVMSPKMVEFVQKEWDGYLAGSGARMQFAPPDWRGFYARLGWKTVAFRDMGECAAKNGREQTSVARKKISRAAWAIRRKIPLGGKQSNLWESGVAVLEKG